MGIKGSGEMARFEYGYGVLDSVWMPGLFKQFPMKIPSSRKFGELVKRVDMIELLSVTSPE